MSEYFQYKPCRYCGKIVKTITHFFVYCSPECKINYMIETESGYQYENNPFIIGDRFMVYFV